MKPLKIISRDNPKIKFLKQLQQKKYREKYEKFFVENAVIICDALKSGFFFESIFVTEDFTKRKLIQVFLRTIHLGIRIEDHIIDLHFS